MQRQFLLLGFTRTYPVKCICGKRSSSQTMESDLNKLLEGVAISYNVMDEHYERSHFKII
jgi:hypothetical protein